MNNVLLKQLKDLNNSNQIKASLFLEWLPVKTSFESVRVWLKNIKEEASRLGHELPAVDKILQDQKVTGHEIKLEKKVKLGDKNVALFFTGEDVVSLNTFMECKDSYFLNNELFILPLLNGLREPQMILQVSESQIQVFYEHVGNFVDITSQFDLPQSLYAMIAEKKGFKLSEAENLTFEELGLSGTTIDEKYKRYAKSVISGIKAKFKDVERLLVVAPRKLGHFVEEEVHGKIETHMIHANPKSMTIDDIREIVFEDHKDRQDPSPDDLLDHSKTVSDIEALVHQNDMGNLGKLVLNKAWLKKELGSLENKSSLLTINKFVWACIEKGVQIHCVDMGATVLMGETRGPIINMSPMASAQ
ncbi:MAG: hypothetical protein MK008_09930 [Bdellovibrionales bacterium]|nr:hypothetical protein [Bdellovibrionales bacterium]